MNARLRSVLRPLLVALVLVVGVSHASGVDAALDPVRDGLRTLAPVIETAAGLPFLSGLFTQVVARPAEETRRLDELFDETFSGPSFDGLERTNDPLIDDLSADDLALLDL